MDGHKRRTLQKKASILNATKRLISKEPLTHITIHDIAKSAIVSQVTIYKLFENKNALIREAIKSLSTKNVNDIINILNKEIPFIDKLSLYFTTAFQNTLGLPRFAQITEYIFSGIDEELKNYVTALYNKTMPGLIKLYNDGISSNYIRKEIDLSHFLSMLDMFTQAHPRFYATPDDLKLLVKSMIKSFS